MANNLKNQSHLALKRAQNWFQGAQRGLEDKRWDDCVYNSQMAGEQAIKAFFIRIGVNYKRIHDVSELFRQQEHNQILPTFFRNKIISIADKIEELTEQRSLAGYGFEEGLNSSHFQNYAPTAIKWADEIVKVIIQVLNQLP